MPSNSERQLGRSALPFLDGGGEMGALMRAHDWASSSIGPPQGWPQALRTSLRLLLNTGHPMFIFWGPEGVCFYNDAYRLSIGPERHPGALGQPALAVWEEIWSVIGPQIEQVMSGGGATWHVNQLLPITRNGKLQDVYWTYSYSPIDDETAPTGVGGVLVVCTETTESVLSGAALRESEERLQRALSTGNGVGTWDWDVPNDRVVSDDRFARLYGVDPAAARAGAPIATFFKSIHPDDIPALQERINRVLQTGGDFLSEYRLIQPDANERWVVAQGRVQLGADGKPYRFPGVSFDITERKGVEQRLRELNADLERQVAERTLARGRTWQLTPDLMGVLDEAGRFEASNPAWQTVLGWSEDEMAAFNWRDLVHPDDVAASEAAWHDAAERGRPVIHFENRYRTKTSEWRWLQWVAVPQGGKVYFTTRDITNPKLQQMELEAAQDALRQSQKMEAVGQLTGGIAHDFNNLLTSITGSLDLTERRIAEGRTTGLDRYIAAAQTSARRAASLTQRLLAFSRRQTLDPRPTDVNRLISSMSDLIRRTVGPSIAVEVVEAGGLWLTQLDASQLESALLNLSINARDAMPDGGRITIETANKWLDERAAKERELPAGQYMSVSVTDNGTGMTTDVISRAFDPFFTTKPIGKGTGLGLSMIHGFVRQSGGQVRIYSEIGAGTTVCLYFPRFIGEIEPVETPEAAAPPDSGRGETVMVIDDELVIRMLMVEVLSEAGYRVIEAGDGPSGLKLLNSDVRIDLLITDVGLPGGINGRQVADAARIKRPELKVLFITGYAENAVIGNGHLEAGMSVVTKPFEINALAARVRDLIERP